MKIGASSGPGGRIISISIGNKDDLYKAYMPFVSNGGLFVRAQKIYELGNEVSIDLTFMDEPEKILITGKVIWVTPKEAQGNRTAGIGVQFVSVEFNTDTISDPDRVFIDNIETHLAGLLESDRPTHTM